MTGSAPALLLRVFLFSVITSLGPETRVSSDLDARLQNRPYDRLRSIITIRHPKKWTGVRSNGAPGKSRSAPASRPFAKPGKKAGPPATLRSIGGAKNSPGPPAREPTRSRRALGFWKDCRSSLSSKESCWSTKARRHQIDRK